MTADRSGPGVHGAVLRRHADLPIVAAGVAGRFRAPQAAGSNPLNRLGLETTVLLFAGLLIAWQLLPVSPQRAFAAFATTVGARYFVFATLYRDRCYWLLGGAIFATAYVYAARQDSLPLNVALPAGIVEAVFAAVLFARQRRA